MDWVLIALLALSAGGITLMALPARPRPRRHPRDDWAEYHRLHRRGGGQGGDA